MVTSNLQYSQRGARTSPSSFMKKLKELDMFYQGKDPVHQTMRRIARRLEKANIPYVVVGGMAVFAQGHRRATNDVDLLLTPEGFTEFKRLLLKRNYALQPGRKRRFVDRASGITVDILLTGLFPGRGEPGPISYPDPATVGEPIGKVQVVNLQTLITLKLAARRHQDFADVVSLIRVHDLDDSYQNQLHSSLRRDYIECLEEKRREDEYIAREA